MTRRAEQKLGALSELFRAAAGERWASTQTGILRRELYFSGFRFLRSLQLIYNWENRFMSVNYNLQLLSLIPTDPVRYEETHDCLFTLRCTQSGLRGKRQYDWDCRQWGGDGEGRSACLERLNHPLIRERLQALDIMELEIRHRDTAEDWSISCESLIGSATWILIPPVLSMITPEKEECVRFLELFEMLGDAVARNR